MTQRNRLTQSLLAQAFRGELVPTEAALAGRDGRSYEPASDLMERIRPDRKRSTESAKPGARQSSPSPIRSTRR